MERTRILMISTEYPPMKGGVGRYTDNLVRSLRKTGFDVYVVCDENGSGEYQEISSTNTNANNSEILLRIVNDLHPDLVHIQYEHGLYGLSMDLKNPNKISTNIDSFYDSCRVPIVTTFHSSYTFEQWMRRAKLRALAIQSKGRQLHFLASLSEYWRHLLNYYSFHRLNWQTFRKSRGSVVFSKYMANMVGGGNVIYHGAEPVIGGTGMPTKEESRRIFSLPQDRRIALAIGFKTVTKGWDIFEKMHVPSGWIVVVNSSRNYYSIENDLDKTAKIPNVIDLQRGFLNDEDFSILLHAVDTIILPYTVSSSSGVMFDALAHNVPFIATNLDFFKEFSAKGLGITVKRDPNEFSNALLTLEKDYPNYTKKIDQFKENLKWDNIARQHGILYSQILQRPVPTLTPPLTPAYSTNLQAQVKNLKFD